MLFSVCLGHVCIGRQKINCEPLTNLKSLFIRVQGFHNLKTQRQKQSKKLSAHVSFVRRQAQLKSAVGHSYFYGLHNQLHNYFIPKHSRGAQKHIFENRDAYQFML